MRSESKGTGSLLFALKYVTFRKLESEGTGVSVKKTCNLFSEIIVGGAIINYNLWDFKQILRDSRDVSEE